MNYKEKYKQAFEIAKEVYHDHRKDRYWRDWLTKLFPELKKSEDEWIRKRIIHSLGGDVLDMEETIKAIAWLEKQSEKKHIINVPPREVILSIWDLGNEWKELTNGSISTEYGTQLDYIQKHWHESEYYLKEKQGKQTQLDYEHADIPQKDFAPIVPKKLDADKVIAWIAANFCDFEYYVKLFKKDFKL